MDIYYLLVSICFFLWTIQKILFLVSLWQIKEYRLDGLSTHLRETVQGRKIFYSPQVIVLILLVMLYLVVVWNGVFLPVYQVIVGLTFFYFGMQTVIAGLSDKLKRPTVTIKSLTLISLGIIGISLLYMFQIVDAYLWLVLLEIIVPLLIAFFVAVFSFPTELYMDFKIAKAKKKVMNMKHLTVIAVSGSYGKSSTKEYIAHILSQKYKVIKTPLSNNTPIGIANTILLKLTKDTDFFIVEMGAYKRGEIAELCDIVKPHISVTTSISDQHLSLFGSLEEVFATENELIIALPKTGVALFNGTNENTKILFEKTKKKKILYTYNKIVRKQVGDIVAYNASVQKNGLEFSVWFKNKEMKFKTQLLGIHNVENILPGIFLGFQFGISEEKIKKAVSTLSALPKTMMKFTLQNGVVVIDDTFNASPESVLAAEKYAKVFTKKRILVLTPLIELGKSAAFRHYELGRSLATFSDIFLTNNNFYKEIVQGITDAKGKTHVFIGKPQQIVQELSAHARNGDIVIFEGKEAGLALSEYI
ncbi:MAG: Mur ligase family protein [Candidatus Levyibacteriota bacterium]